MTIPVIDDWAPGTVWGAVLRAEVAITERSGPVTVVRPARADRRAENGFRTPSTLGDLPRSSAAAELQAMQVRR
jgi:hypothetical protein